jgi:membrane peptidoglycan carboxypeptidase
MRTPRIRLLGMAGAGTWTGAVCRRLRREIGLHPALVGGLLLAGAVHYEARTSLLQSWLFARAAGRLTYDLQPGPSPRVAFPADGPFDRRRGYTRIPQFASRLRAHGFRIAEQARFSTELVRHVRRGYDPPEWLPDRAGLVVRGSGGEILYGPAESFFGDPREVPALLESALLFIEDRGLARAGAPLKNPSVDWPRFGRATFLFAAGRFGFEVPSEGGSTLATQLEKLRHSARGRTDSPQAKLGQMWNASLKSYRGGRDTRRVRSAIVARYLNSLPLSATPGHGEVHGLGSGLRAWFGLELSEVARALEPGVPLPERARAFKHALALICAVREPTRFLQADRAALEARVDAYLDLMAQRGIIDHGLAREALDHPLGFDPQPRASSLRAPSQRKAVNGVRRSVLGSLGLKEAYDLDRLHLDVRSTLDSSLQEDVARLLRRLRDPRYLSEQGLRQDRLLGHADLDQVQYSVLLFERTPRANVLRVQIDSLHTPFDLNEGPRLELGSTAKLRVLTHYLDIVARLHHELSATSPRDRRARTRRAGDPLTAWAGERLGEGPISLPDILQAALERRYSASPAERFFTGGGVHVFHNFDSADDGSVLTVREATVRSVNLVYVRLLRDLVRFHQGRLPYDARAVLAEADHPSRKGLLEREAEGEARVILFRAWKRLRNASEAELLEDVLGPRRSARRLAIAYFAWPAQGPKDAAGLSAWLSRLGVPTTQRESLRLIKAYGDPRLSLADHAYLLDRHPLEVWAAGQLHRQPDARWDDLWSSSPSARRTASAWLFKGRHRAAQQRRLRVQIERDAFDLMAREWRRLGFPFDRLVPSLATALGSSSDQPMALAELMGIIVNDGRRLPSVRIDQLRFAEHTPYHTIFTRAPAAPVQVLPRAVARAVCGVLADVVDSGTARRVAGAIARPDGTAAAIGGKTGSGDNRRLTFSRQARLVSSVARNRTATFVFHVDGRYFGVITAMVDGRRAGRHRFTSALPVMLLKLLAPALGDRL